MKSSTDGAERTGARGPARTPVTVYFCDLPSTVSASALDPEGAGVSRLEAPPSHPDLTF